MIGSVDIVNEMRRVVVVVVVVVGQEAVRIYRRLSFALMYLGSATLGSSEQ